MQQRGISAMGSKASRVHFVASYEAVALTRIQQDAVRPRIANSIPRSFYCDGNNVFRGGPVRITEGQGAGLYNRQPVGSGESGHCESLGQVSIILQISLSLHFRHEFSTATSRPHKKISGNKCFTQSVRTAA